MKNIKIQNKLNLQSTYLQRTNYAQLISVSQIEDYFKIHTKWSMSSREMKNRSLTYWRINSKCSENYYKHYNNYCYSGVKINLLKPKIINPKIFNMVENK